MGIFRRSPALRIEFDDGGVRRLEGAAVVEAVTWDALRAVEIRTTAAGPRDEDLFWLLHGPDESGVVVPSGLMPDGLLERLQELPGFDNEAVIASMASVSEAVFPCWSRA